MASSPNGEFALNDDLTSRIELGAEDHAESENIARVMLRKITLTRDNSTSSVF